MYKRELKSLKECFEEVKTLHERKNLNIMDSRVGQEVVKFLRNASAGDSIDSKLSLFQNSFLFEDGRIIVG